jgi:hypothetical protein
MSTHYWRRALPLQDLSRWVMTVVAWTVLAASVAAQEPSPLESKLPRTYEGEFRWHGDRRPQKVEIKIISTNRLDSQHVEALGCGRYDASGLVTNIRVRMKIDVMSLDVEIWELDAVGSVGFTTSGSHKGRLTDNLQEIDAEWTTQPNGPKGRLLLRAGGEFTCAAESVSVPRPVRSS